MRNPNRVGKTCYESQRRSNVHYAQFVLVASWFLTQRQPFINWFYQLTEAEPLRMVAFENKAKANRGSDINSNWKLPHIVLAEEFARTVRYQLALHKLSFFVTEKVLLRMLMCFSLILSSFYNHATAATPKPGKLTSRRDHLIHWCQDFNSTYDNIFYFYFIMMFLALQGFICITNPYKKKIERNKWVCLFRCFFFVERFHGSHSGVIKQ